MSEEQDARWQQILDARADLADEPVPLRPVGRDGVQRRGSGSRKSARFNEALSGFSNWSSVERPRRRLSA